MSRQKSSAGRIREEEERTSPPNIHMRSTVDGLHESDRETENDRQDTGNRNRLELNTTIQLILMTHHAKISTYGEHQWQRGNETEHIPGSNRVFIGLQNPSGVTTRNEVQQATHPEFERLTCPISPRKSIPRHDKLL